MTKISDQTCIVFGFHEKEYLPVLSAIYQEFSISKTYTTYYLEKAPEEENIIKIQFQDREINRYADYNIPIRDLNPIDEILLNQLAHCEINCLKMMDRLNSFNPMREYEYRKRIYLRHVQYWNHILTTEKPLFTLFSNIPHQIYDYIVWNLCQIYNIPSIVLFQLQIPDSMIFFENYENHSSQIQADFLKNQELSENSPDQMVLLPNFRKYYNEQLSKEKNPTPFYMKKKTTSKISQIKEISKRVFHHETSLNPITHLKMRQQINKEQELFDYYAKIAQEPDYTKNYIYLGFHYQPELTTCPLAGVFVDQLLIVDMIAKSLPTDWYLFVKEHPNQKLNGRMVEFYHDLQQYPNVCIIKKSANTFNLINNCQAVATATGTMGLEAQFREKPTLLFGHIFYEYLPYVFTIKTQEDISEALQKIQKNQYCNYHKDLETLFFTLGQHSINGVINSAYHAISLLPFEERIKNIQEPIIEKIKSFKSEK